MVYAFYNLLDVTYPKYPKGRFSKTVAFYVHFVNTYTLIKKFIGSSWLSNIV